MIQRVQLRAWIIRLLALAVLIQCANAQEDQCIRAYGTAYVEEFLRDLQHSVSVDDRAHVVELVQFPISIKVAGKPLVLRNKDQLLKNYEIAFDLKVKSFIAKQKFSELFCNWKGIMIGRGEIWIDWPEKSSHLKIIAINNNPPWSPEGK